MQNRPGPQTYVTRRGANHGLHIVLTILTCGVWAFTGWPIAAAMGRRTRTTVYPAPQQPYYPPPPGYGHQPPPPPPGRYGPPPR